MDNKMMGVAKLLGVELEEKFRIKGAPTTSIYKISEEGLVLHHKEENWWEAVPYMLALLLTGERKIGKLPWRPKIGENYYVPFMHYSEPKMFTQYRWRDSDLDNKFYRFGFVCQTKDEAIAQMKKMLAALQEANDE